MSKSRARRKMMLKTLKKQRVYKKKKKEGERGWIKEQECRAADAMLLSACVNPAQFLNSVSIRQHVISSALLCLDPAVDGAVRGHVMKGRCPLRFF